MRVLTGGGRAEINFSNFLQAPPSPLPFHDAAPEECRLPWKPFLGPLLGWMSGLLSLERLWQGESWECFEDGLHFCSVFSGRVFFSFALRFVELCLGGRSAFGLPREPEGPACTWHTSIPAPFGTAPRPVGTKAAAQAGQQNAL